MLHKILTAVTALAVVASLLAGAAGQASAAVANDDSAYFGESAFLTLGPGQSGQFAVGFNNTGSAGWLTGSANQIDLAVCLPDKTTCNTTSPNAAFASAWLSSTAYATTSTTYVGPGQTGYFVYNVTVPTSATPGTYRFNGDLALHGTASMIHPEGYYQDVQVPSVGAPAKLACSLTPSSIVAGSTQTATLTVTVQDASGNTVTTNNGYSITVSESGTLSGGIDAPNPATTTNGVATFVVNASTPSTNTGTDQLSAAGTRFTTAAALTGCLSNLTFTAPGAPTALKFTSPTQTQYPTGLDTAGTATVKFLDSSGANTTTTASATTVTFTASDSNICYVTNTPGTTSVNVVVGASSATASTPFHMTGVPGTCTLTATSTGLTSATKTLTASASGVASQLAITGNTCVNAATTASGGTTCTVTVQVQDAAGNPVFGTLATDNPITLTLTKTSSTCTATITATTPTTGQLGLGTQSATADAGTGSTVKFTLANSRAETCTATATSPSTPTSAPTTSVSWTGFGPADNVTLKPLTQTIAANGVSTATLTACVRDASGNIVTTANGDSMTLLETTGTDGTNSTIISTNPTTTSSGCATFTVQSTTTPGTDTYTAVDTSTRTFITSGTSNPANVVVQ